MGSQISPEINSDDKRTKKATKIAVADGAIKQLSKNVFEVRSQSWAVICYRVERLEDNATVFSCQCKDFQYRISSNICNDPMLRECKHIKSVKLYLKQKELTQHIEQTPELPKICSRCQSTKIARFGFRILKTGAKRQRYKCLQCHRRFIVGENGFCKTADPAIVTEALNLIFSGLSYRACERHLRLAHGRVWHSTTILRWVKRYTGIIKNFVDSQRPQLDDVWCLDEMMLNVKDTKETGVGFYDWVWTIISPQTKFVLAVEISKKREIADARRILATAKENAKGQIPSYIITDSLMTYKDAILKELDARKTLHIRTNSLKDGFQNRPIERYHNEARQTLKARRGMGNDKSAQDFMEFHRIMHNFVRPHTGLQDNKTPAEAAKIDLKLKPENKLEDLIVKSADNKAISDGKFAVHLGFRVQYVEISNEKDSIKVKPKGWLDKQIWKEINDILRVHQFAWVSNGKDSCWIKMQSI
jgi:putative transposase